MVMPLLLECSWDMLFNRSYLVCQGEDKSFVAALNRLATPWASCQSPSPLFYSTNIGPVHIVSVNSYVSLAKYTNQYRWLEVCSRAVAHFLIF